MSPEQIEAELKRNYTPYYTEYLMERFGVSQDAAITIGMECIWRGHRRQGPVIRRVDKFWYKPDFDAVFPEVYKLVYGTELSSAVYP